MHEPNRAVVVLALCLLLLLLMALYNAYRTRRAERGHPPAGRFVQVDGVRLHYLELGQGPTVVLLHGNLLGAEDFVPSGVPQQLAERHRVIVFDRPGYGYSARPRGLWTPARQAVLLRRALAQLGVERPVVVGHSWGTLVALEMALQQQASLAGLVLLAGYYRPTPRLDVLFASTAALPLIGPLWCHTLGPLLGAALLSPTFKALFAPRAVPRAFLQGFPGSLMVRPAQLRAEGQDGVTMLPAVAGMRGRYRQLRLPVFIMSGTGDRIVSHRWQSVWLHRQLPASHLRVLPGVGHMLHYAAAEQVVEAVECIADEARAPTERGASRSE